MTIRWWIGDRRVTGREFGAELLAISIEVALNVLVVFWLGQLAFPSLGMVPPTLLGAVGIAGLAAVLRRPLPIARWMRG